jgi:hypothetical protein
MSMTKAHGPSHWIPKTYHPWKNTTPPNSSPRPRGKLRGKTPHLPLPITSNPPCLPQYYTKSFSKLLTLLLPSQHSWQRLYECTLRKMNGYIRHLPSSFRSHFKTAFLSNDNAECQPQSAIWQSYVIIPFHILHTNTIYTKSWWHIWSHCEKHSRKCFRWRSFPLATTIRGFR